MFSINYWRCCETANVAVLRASEVCGSTPLPYNKYEDRTRSHTPRADFTKDSLRWIKPGLKKIKKLCSLSYPSSLSCCCCSRRIEGIIIVVVGVHRCRRHHPKCWPHPWLEPLSLPWSEGPPWHHRCTPLGVGAHGRCWSWRTLWQGQATRSGQWGDDDTSMTHPRVAPLDLVRKKLGEDSRLVRPRFHTLLVARIRGDV